MILSRRAALNGVQLDELYGRIVIRGIELGATEESVDTVSMLGGAGQRILRTHAETMTVTVKWAMDVPKDDLITRRRIYEDVCKWARQKGWLTVSYMPERKLYVDKVKFSGAELFKWTDEYEITFTAYSVPFWQDVFPVSVEKTNVSSTTFNMVIPGQEQTVAEVDFINTSTEALTSFSIAIGGSTISLTGLLIVQNIHLIIDHTETGILRIYGWDGVNAVSGYSLRTAGSADDLYVDPGTAGVALIADKAGTLKVSVRGRYGS